MLTGDRPRSRAVFRDAVLGPIFWAMFRARTREQREWSYPTGTPVVCVRGIAPVRVLVIGDGAAAGCGVLIHELGIAGFLARHIAEYSGRGVIVTVSAQPAASARSTLGCLDGVDLAGYDAIVLMLATTDAFCLTGRRSWQRSMTGLVEALTSAPCAAVFVTSTASMHLTRSISPFGRFLTGRHARMLDIETERICARLGVPMITLNAVNDLTSRAYATWGRRIGTHISRALRGAG